MIDGKIFFISLFVYLAFSSQTFHDRKFIITHGDRHAHTLCSRSFHHLLCYTSVIVRIRYHCTAWNINQELRDVEINSFRARECAAMKRERIRQNTDFYHFCNFYLCTINRRFLEKCLSDGNSTMNKFKACNI